MAEFPALQLPGPQEPLSLCPYGCSILTVASRIVQFLMGVGFLLKETKPVAHTGYILQDVICNEISHGLRPCEVPLQITLRHITNILHGFDFHGLTHKQLLYSPTPFLWNIQIIST